MTPKTKNPKTERIKQRLEQLKAAKPAAAEEEPLTSDIQEVPLTESDVTESANPVKAATASVKAGVGNKEEFTLDGASKFTWLLDGEHLTGYVRFNDNTITISDPIIGYTYSLPTSLPLVIHTRGIGRLVSVDSAALPKPPASVKLRNGVFTASMAVPISLPRVAWREVNKKIVWAIVQYAPTKAEWRILRLRSTPVQTVYEAQQILRALLGNAYDKLKEAVELLAEPL